MRLAAGVRSLAAAALALSTGSLGAQTIDTRVTDRFLQSVQGDVIVGQSFTAPIGAGALTDFTLWIGGYDSYTYRVLLYAANGTSPTGPALFTSDVRTAPASPAVYWEETFLVGSVPVAPGALYAVLVQTTDPVAYLNVQAEDADPATVLTFDSTYDGGEYLICGYAADPTTAACDGNVTGADLSFVAHFAPSAVPEPSAVVLLAAGLLGLGVAGRSRRRAPPR
jgi:hypothetical protein